MLFPVQMNKIFFLQLIFNASMLLSLAIIYDLLAIRRHHDRSLLHQVPSGLIISLVGIILMLFSWQMAPGIIFDTRSILLGVSGLYFGAIPTAIAMTATAVYRGCTGGMGMIMGIAVILTSGVFGIAWRRMRRGQLADLTWRELIGFGLAVHLVMLLCTIFLPGTIRWQVLKNIALPVMLVYPAVTAMLGKLMAGRLKRERTHRQLRESEEKYQNLASVSPVGIFRTDVGGRTTYVNPMWCEISGLDAGAALGDGWLQAVHPSDRELLRQGWEDAARAHLPSMADYRFLHADGKVVWVMGRATLEKDSAGQVTGYVGTITDISERRQAEEIVRASLKEKEILLKEVHHRVKNNLMTIIGLIKMQEKKAAEATENTLLLELEGRIRSMAMVHESLYKSDNLARIDLRQYIKGMVLHIQAQFKTACNIRLEMRAVGIDVGLDIAVPCGLILNELITNAFKHAFPEGGADGGDGTPEVKVVTAAQDGTLILTVADNGVGFPASGDLGETQTLGLNLVRMLSQQLRGRVESIGKTGTVIRVQFPLPVK